ncbi:TPA: OsmC family protein [Klebsiella aerogenes]|nr:OsmC family protein [Klebsiella aerogenes]
MHEFSYNGEWFGGYDGHGVISSGNLATIISRPQVMNGPGKGTNPDELLISAAGSCFLMSLTYILQKERIDFVKVQISSVGRFEPIETGVRFRELEHVAQIVLAKELDNLDEVIADIIEKADERCMVSNALRATVKISVFSRVRLQGPQSAT